MIWLYLLWCGNCFAFEWINWQQNLLLFLFLSVFYFFAPYFSFLSVLNFKANKTQSCCKLIFIDVHFMIISFLLQFIFKLSDLIFILIAMVHGLYIWLNLIFLCRCFRFNFTLISSLTKFVYFNVYIYIVW